MFALILEFLRVMTQYVAFLQILNASGGTTLKSEQLKDLFEKMGMHNVSPFATGGNVIFETGETEEKILRKQIETSLANTLGFKVSAILRQYDELKTVIDNNPFDNIRSGEESKWYITFLSDFPSSDAKGSLGVYSNDAEYARIVMREVYIYAKSYNSQTHFSNAFIERKLGLSATTRNWLTVKKMAELHP